MRAANRALLLGLALASAACRQAPPSDENVAFDNQATTTTDIEALPPDESAATPTDELINGDSEVSNAEAPSNTD